IEQLVMAEPDEPHWHFYLAEAAKRMGRGMTAADEFRRAARAYARRQDVVRAIAACRLMLEIEPDRNIRELLDGLLNQQRKDDSPGWSDASAMAKAQAAASHAASSQELPAASRRDDAESSVTASSGSHAGLLSGLDLGSRLSGKTLASGTTEYLLDEETGKL